MNLLFHLDGKLPNLALMRLSAHLKAAGDEVTFRRTGQPERTLWEQQDPRRVYASTIFESSRPIVHRLIAAYPKAIVGGTGYNIQSDLTRDIGIPLDGPLDYSLYPNFMHSIGFTQRGCRLKCKFCVVPRKEGKIIEATSVMGIWRGPGHPKNLLLLDNDFFGSPQWRSKIKAIQFEEFKVCFSQGINVRLIDDEAAEAIGSISYFDDSFTTRRIYTAWDNRKDEQRLFDGLKRLVRYGVKPYHIMVYMLVGYWPGETEQDRLYRQQKLRDFGCVPYPMPFVRTTDLIGFQRWVIGAYDKRIPWVEWKAAHCRPEKLSSNKTAQVNLFPVIQEVSCS